MKRQELLQRIDTALLERLYGFCYQRCANSIEASELCSEILLRIVKAASKDGEIEQLDGFLWKIAYRTYADYSAQRKKQTQITVAEDPAPLLEKIAVLDDTESEVDTEALRRIYREIAFLSRDYRECMIRYYLDGASTREIAKSLSVTENTVRQRLFHARNVIRKEVKKMDYNPNKPLAMQPIHLFICGNGSPTWGDPREVSYRQLSQHIVWLCRNRERSAKEISEELNVPMLYVEEELQIQCNGVNGKYGLLRKTENGKYITNFLLLDQKETEEARALYAKYIPKLCDRICEYVVTHKEDLLSFPYLNQKVEWNLVLWQNLANFAGCFSDMVDKILKETYFPDVPSHNRKFSVFGHIGFDGETYGCGWDGINAKNICGYSDIHMDNIYFSRIQAHFHCGHNIGEDALLQLALRAINGLDQNTLSEAEKESAAKAIECGYLYREGNVLYTKILACRMEDHKRFWSSAEGLREYFRQDAEIVAEQVAAMIRKRVPKALMSDYRFYNIIASVPEFDLVAEALIERGMLTVPENGIGAEGCWMFLQK